MPRGKAHTCPRIVVTHAVEPRFASRDEAWAVVGPIIARILAQAILADKKKEKLKGPVGKKIAKEAS